jgi:PIN domain nuclease of toxin-antitoxin system
LKLLLDTCTFLWLNMDRARLPLAIQQLCAAEVNELYLSVVSAWEIAINHSSGRLSLPEQPGKYVPSRRMLNGIAALPLREGDVFQLSKLPQLHRDPFDRLLVCQVIAHGLAIVTPDEQIAQYPIRVLW